MLGFPFPEGRWSHNADAVKRIEHLQILISSDDRHAFAGHCGRQDDIVIAVAAHRWVKDLWRDEREGLGKEINGRARVHLSLPKLTDEDVAKLVQQRLRGNDGVTADAVLQNITAHATRDQRRDEHVGVERQFHDTRPNTSSSV